MKLTVSFFTGTMHDARTALRYTRTVLWIFGLMFIPLLSLFQNARLLGELVVTLDDYAGDTRDLPTTWATTTTATTNHQLLKPADSSYLFDDDTSLAALRRRRRHLTDGLPLSVSDPATALSSSQHQHHQHSTNNNNLHIVISHCDQPIDWIWKHYLWNQPFTSMTILSKCQTPPSMDQLPPAAALPTTLFDNNNTTTNNNNNTNSSNNSTQTHVPLFQILLLPNVGRCDHSYAYWMSKLLGSGNGNHDDDRHDDMDDLVPYQLNFTNDVKRIGLVHGRDMFTTSEDDHDDALILFMKDNDNAYRANMDVEVPLHAMIESLGVSSGGRRVDDAATTIPTTHNSSTTVVVAAATHSIMTNDTTTTTPPLAATTRTPATTAATFACGTKLRTGFPGFYRTKDLLKIDERERASNLAQRRALWTFQVGEYSSSAGLLKRSEDHDDFVSPYRPMGKWIKHLQYDLNAFEDGFYEGTYQGNNYDLVPACFGGNFMTTMSNIRNSPVRNWTAIVESLGRGDNIEEGHYMERLWAHLLSPAFTKAERKDILEKTSRYFLDGAFTGMMVTLATDRCLTCTLRHFLQSSNPLRKTY